MVGCVCVGEIRSSGFCDQRNQCQMVGHNKMNIISGVGHLRSKSVVPLVVDGSVQWLGHQYCIACPSGECQLC
jgi:hypothetical protein